MAGFPPMPGMPPGMAPPATPPPPPPPTGMPSMYAMSGMAGMVSTSIGPSGGGSFGPISSGQGVFKYTVDDCKALMQNREWKKKWEEYCDQYHQGYYDPKRLTVAQINDGIRAVGEPPPVRQPQPHEVRKEQQRGWTAEHIKKCGKLHPEWKKKWEAYCDLKHRGYYDPGKLTPFEMAQAIASVGPPPDVDDLFTQVAGAGPPPPTKEQAAAMFAGMSAQVGERRTEEVRLTRETKGEKLGFNVNKEMQLTTVTANTPAGRCGLANYVGWSLLKINGTQVTTLEQAAQFLGADELNLVFMAPTAEAIKDEELRKFDEELNKFKSIDTRRLMIISRVKNGQRGDWREKWENYCVMYGTGKFDPNQYTTEYIMEAFRVLGVPPRPELKKKTTVAQNQPMPLHYLTASAAAASSTPAAAPAPAPSSSRRSRSRERRRDRSYSRGRDRRDRDRDRDRRESRRDDDRDRDRDREGRSRRDDDRDRDRDREGRSRRDDDRDRDRDREGRSRRDDDRRDEDRDRRRRDEGHSRRRRSPSRTESAGERPAIRAGSRE